jgi:hypothetical protein
MLQEQALFRKLSIAPKHDNACAAIDRITLSPRPAHGKELWGIAAQDWRSSGHLTDTDSLQGRPKLEPAELRFPTFYNVN